HHEGAVAGIRGVEQLSGVPPALVRGILLDGLLEFPHLQLDQGRVGVVVAVVTGKHSQRIVLSADSEKPSGRLHRDFRMAPRKAFSRLTSGRKRAKTARMPAATIWMASGALQDRVLWRRPVAIVMPLQRIEPA
ncbi:unnamed protein product, partial [Mycena citricolor]